MATVVWVVVVVVVFVVVVVVVVAPATFTSGLLSTRDDNQGPQTPTIMEKKIKTTIMGLLRVRS